MASSSVLHAADDMVRSRALGGVYSNGWQGIIQPRKPEIGKENGIVQEVVSIISESQPLLPYYR